MSHLADKQKILLIKEKRNYFDNIHMIHWKRCFDLSICKNCWLWKVL